MLFLEGYAIVIGTTGEKIKKQKCIGKESI
jgi:hypothetical protein